MNDKIKALEREVELLQQVIELTKQLEELKAKQPVYVPYVPPYQPWEPYRPSPWWEYNPGTIIYWTSDSVTVNQ